MGSVTGYNPFRSREGAGLWERFQYCLVRDVEEGVGISVMAYDD